MTLALFHNNKRWVASELGIGDGYSGVGSWMRGQRGNDPHDVAVAFIYSKVINFLFDMVIRMMARG